MVAPILALAVSILAGLALANETFIGCFNTLPTGVQVVTTSNLPVGKSLPTDVSTCTVGPHPLCHPCPSHV
jgi:hypothetical protein